MSTTYRSQQNGAINVWGVSILLVAIVAIQLLGETTQALTNHRRMRRLHEPMDGTCNLGINNETYLQMNRMVEKFSAKLMLAMGASDKSETRNLLVSPISAQVALNMLLLGLRGQTRDELIELLGYRESPDYEEKSHKFMKSLHKCFNSINQLERKDDSLEPKLDMWNGVIGNRRLKLDKNFEHQLRELYDTEISLIDIENEQAGEGHVSHKSVLDRYNGWSEQAGLGEILKSKDLKNQDLMIMLISAIRVEAHWFKKFHEIPASIGSYRFKQQGKELISADGLFRDKMAIRLIELSKRVNSDDLSKKYGSMVKDLGELEFRVIDLLMAGDLSLTIIEPTGDKPSLHELNKNLFDANGLKFKLTLQILDEEATIHGKALVTIPKFNFTSEIDLKDVLQKMGLERVFKRGEAEMAILSDGGKSYVSKAKQKAMIEVTENGVKAAAVTLIELTLLSFERPGIIIEVAQPFLFVFRYKRVPLFIGQLRQV